MWARGAVVDSIHPQPILVMRARLPLGFKGC